MGEAGDPGAARRLKAAEEVARILKAFGGEGAKRAHDLLEALKKGGHADPKAVKAIESALLEALMDRRVKSRATPRKTTFLHVLVPEKPLRPEIRAAYKEFEAAFAKGAADPAKI
jgi:hypothetical protein